MTYLRIDAGEIVASNQFVPDNHWMIKLPNKIIIPLDQDYGLRLEKDTLIWKEESFPLSEVLVFPKSESGNHLERATEYTFTLDAIMDDFWKKKTIMPDPDNIDSKLVFTKAVVQAIKTMGIRKPITRKDSVKLMNDMRILNQAVQDKREVSFVVAVRILDAFGVQLRNLFKEELL